MISELQRQDTETGLRTVIRGSIHGIESPWDTSDCALVFVRANRSVTPVLVPADLLEKEKITQESVIELTVVQHAADVPPTAIGVCVRSHALPLPVAGESYELAGRDRYRFTARQQRGQ